jgi:hypothetical protein
MRRSASEIINDLEMRVAHLEKSSSSATRYQDFYLNSRAMKFLQDKLNKALGGIGEYYEARKRIPVLNEKHTPIWAGIEMKAELWKSWKDKEAEVVIYTNVTFADYKGKQTKKLVVWVLEIDPSYLEYDPYFDDDGKTPILEKSILRAILASKSELQYGS